MKKSYCTCMRCCSFASYHENRNYCAEFYVHNPSLHPSTSSPPNNSIIIRNSSHAPELCQLPRASDNYVARAGNLLQSPPHSSNIHSLGCHHNRPNDIFMNEYSGQNNKMELCELPRASDNYVARAGNLLQSPPHSSNIHSFAFNAQRLHDDSSLHPPSSCHHHEKYHDRSLCPPNIPVGKEKCVDDYDTNDSLTQHGKISSLSPSSDSKVSTSIPDHQSFIDLIDTLPPMMDDKKNPPSSLKRGHIHTSPSSGIGSKSRLYPIFVYYLILHFIKFNVSLFYF